MIYIHLAMNSFFSDLPAFWQLSSILSTFRGAFPTFTFLLFSISYFFSSTVLISFFSDFLPFLISYFFDFLFFPISYFFWCPTFSLFLLFLISSFFRLPTFFRLSTFSDFQLFPTSYFFSFLLPTSSGFLLFQFFLEFPSFSNFLLI